MSDSSVPDRRNRWKSLVKPLISGLLLVLLLTQLDLGSVVTALAAARWAGVWVALALFIAGIVIRAFRWQVLLNALGMRVPLRQLTSWYFVGGFFNTVLPTGFGGDAVKAAELAHYSGQTGEAIGSVVVDRFLGIVALLAMAVAALAAQGLSGLVPPGEALDSATNWIDPRLAWFVTLLFAGSLAGFWLLRRRELMHRLSQLLPKAVRTATAPIAGFSRSLYDGLQGYSRRTLAYSLAVSFLFNATWIAVNMLLGWALGIEATLAQYLVFVPLVSLSLLVPSVGGLGVRELTYVGLFGLIGVSQEQAFALGILVYGVTVATGLIGGVIYLIQGTREYRALR